MTKLEGTFAFGPQMHRTFRFLKFLSAAFLLLLTAFLVKAEGESDAQGVVEALPRQKVLIVTNGQESMHWPLQVLMDIMRSFYAGDMNAPLDVRIISVESPTRKIEDSLKDLDAYLRETPVNLIIATNPQTVDGILEYVPVVKAKNIPLLFYAGREESYSQKQIYQNLTGIFRVYDINATVRAGLSMLPHTKKVLVLVGGPNAAKIERQARESLADLKGVEVQYLVDKNATTDILIDEVSALPKDSFIVAMEWFPKNNPTDSSFVGMLALIREWYGGAVFSTIDAGWNIGLAGGCLTESHTYAESVVRMARKILATGSADIPYEEVHSAFVYDAKELSRLHIPPSVVPTNARVLNQPPSLWQMHSAKISIFMGALLILFSVLGVAIVYLWTSRFWREKNTAYLRKNNAIFGALPSSVSVFDNAGNLLFYRANALSPHENASPNQVPLNLSGFYSAKVLPKIMECIWQVLETGESRRHEHFGEGHWYQTLITPAPTSLFGKPAAICATSCIDDLKQAQENLDGTIARLHSTLHSIGDGVIAVDERGLITVFNRVAQSLSGIGDSDAVGRSADEILRFCDHAQGKSVPSPICDALVSAVGHKVFTHLDLLGREGARIPVAVTVSPISLANEARRGAVVVLRDMSQELAIQEEMAEKNALLLYGAKIARVNFFRGAIHSHAAIENIGGEELWIRRDGVPVEPSKFLIAEDFEGYTRAWKRFLQSATGEFKYDFRSDYSGSRRYFSMRALFFTPKEGHSPTYFGVIQDVTETRRNEQRYYDMQLLLGSVMDGLPTYIFAKDVDDNFRYLLCNREFAGILGRTPDQIAGKLDRDIFENQKDIDIFVATDNEVVRTGQEVDNKECFLSANGIWRTARVIKKLVICADGRRLLLGMGIDISRQEKVECELRRRDQESRRILDNVASSVILLDSQLNMLHANPTACKIAGVNPSELVNRSCTRAICRGTSGPQCPAMQALKDGETHSIITPKMPDGHIYSIVAKPFRDAQGNITGVVETGQDITDLLDATNKAAEALKKAREAAQARSAFLATMSHEIRTPLNAVIGFSELLQNEDIESKQRTQFSSSINMAGKALLRIINDILDLSKIESAKLELHLVPTRIDYLLGEIREIFSLSASQKQLAFEVLAPAHAPSMMLDDIRLRQVLFNIVGNAVKFTNAGFVKLSCQIFPACAGTCSLRITVSDSGMGISEEFQKHIFEPFSQQFTRGTRAYQGSGLGMAIAKRLIEQMGGQLSLKSKSGEGSTFIVSIPSVRIVRDEEGVSEREDAPVTALSALRQCSVLIVDDVPMNCIVLESLLRKLGVSARCAHSADEALDRMRERPDDLVLTDLWMPQRSGEDLARALRSSEETKHIPLWAVTADTESSEKFDTSLFDGIILKPVTLSALAKSLRSAGF